MSARKSNSPLWSELAWWVLAIAMLAVLGVVAGEIHREHLLGMASAEAGAVSGLR